MKLFVTSGLLAICLIQPGHAADVPEAFVPLLEKHAKACDQFEFGTLTLKDGAVVQADLDGRGALDWVLDDFKLSCSTAASLFCGTGGCEVHFLIDGVIETQLSKGWTAVDFGPTRVVLSQVHGSECGGTNVNSCVAALVWDAENAAFNTVSPPVEGE